MQNLKLTGSKTINVHCGEVCGDGRRASGCGAKPRPKGFNEYAYLLEGYQSLWSTVSFCPRCEAKLTKRIKLAV